MRDDLTKLNDLKCEIIAITMDIESTQKQLSNINQEYQILKEIKNDLEYNIEFLKKEKITVIAHEYQKSIDELRHINKKLNALDKRYSILVKDYAKLDKKQSELTIEYEKQLKLCSDYQVVLPFDLSRKKRK